MQKVPTCEIIVVVIPLNREMDDITDMKNAYALRGCVEILPCRMRNGNDARVAVIQSTTLKQVLNSQMLEFPTSRPTETKEGVPLDSPLG